MGVGGAAEILAAEAISQSAGVCGLEGGAKSQLMLHYIQECRPDCKAVFWIESGQKQTIERDYLQLYCQLFRGDAETGQDMVKLEDTVLAFKSYFYS